MFNAKPQVEFANKNIVIAYKLLSWGLRPKVLEPMTLPKALGQCKFIVQATICIVLKPLVVKLHKGLIP